MTPLLLLMTFEICTLMWLHLAAVERNLHTMQRHLASQPVNANGIWVEARGMPYSFRICAGCVECLLQS
jgi:hypothetical protein